MSKILNFTCEIEDSKRDPKDTLAQRGLKEARPRDLKKTSSVSGKGQREPKGKPRDKRKKN